MVKASKALLLTYGLTCTLNIGYKCIVRLKDYIPNVFNIARRISREEVP
jgi:hypothetical protein